ncbi:MAG TPA: S41 family peptidase [Gemmataceae bacterium]|nr:S41 family peptidase [Gemmataceae bacterium]
MTKAFFTGLLAALLAGLTALPARAAEAKPARSQPYVVVVGIGQYADKQITPRPRAEDDAKALYDLFTNPKYLGADADHARLLLGTEDAQRHARKATRENILEALEWLKHARSDDLVILAFIGEGCSLGERGDHRCYFATDSTVKGRAKDAVAAATVGEILDKVKSRRFCALVDVNFKGFTTKQSIPEPDFGKDLYKEFLGDDGTEDHAAAPGHVVFLATNGLTPALDLAKHDAFIQVVLDGLEGAADKDGYEPDGVVTVDELMEYLDKQLPEEVRTHGKTVEQKESTHLVLGGRGSHFVLTKDPAVADKVQQRLDKLAELKKDKKISAELAEEGEGLLRRMPKLEAQRDLRKAYEELVAGKLTPDQFTQKRDEILDSRKLKHSAAVAYAKSVMEVIDLLKENYVKDLNRGQLVAWAVRGLYRQIDEKVPDEVNDKLNSAKDMTAPELQNLLVDVRERLGKREDLANHKDVDLTLLRMMKNHLDPFTTYIDPETAGRVDNEIQGQFTGIGIQIRKDAASDMLQVVTPIKGSPAYKAGIQAGDIVTTITRDVDSEGNKLDKPEVISTKGLPLSDAVKKILGLPGTRIKLTVQRAGADKPLTFALNRGRVEVESVLGYKRKSDAGWDYWVDPVNKIAYIRLTSFARNTYADLQKAMKELDKEGVKGLVLDLRFNPGGYLDSATNISDLFIDDGLIVTVRPRIGREIPYYGHTKGSYLNFPMVCLINGGSASGSEILASCLQDNHRAVIIGERSYGKGLVQNIQRFEGGELKMTIASFWRPSGKNLSKLSTKGGEDEDWGVRPDKGFRVDLPRKERFELDEHLRNAEVILPPGKPAKEKGDFKDVQLEKGLEYLRGLIPTAAKAEAKKAG